jgi:hypothetical protein
MSIKREKQLKEMAKSMQNIEIHMATIADSLSQLLDFVGIINFDELAEREEQLKMENEKRL